jgi:hypothetical protein
MQRTGPPGDGGAEGPECWWTAPGQQLHLIMDNYAAHKHGRAILYSSPEDLSWADLMLFFERTARQLSLPVTFLLVTDAAVARAETRREWFGLWRLLAIVVGIWGCIGLTIPLAWIMAGKDTSLTINAVLTFSLAATVGLTVSGIGWLTTHRGKRELVRQINELELEKRGLQDKLRAALEASEPKDLSGEKEEGQ